MADQDVGKAGKVCEAKVTFSKIILAQLSSPAAPLSSA